MPDEEPAEWRHFYVARAKGSRTVYHHDADFMQVHIPMSRKFKNVARHTATMEFADRNNPSLSAFFRLAVMLRVRDLTGLSAFEVMQKMQSPEPGWHHGAITRVEENRFYELSQLTT